MFFKVGTSECNIIIILLLILIASVAISVRLKQR